VPPAITNPGFPEALPSRILIIDDNPRIHRDFELVLLEELKNPELDSDEQRLYGQPIPPGHPQFVYALDHASSGREGIGKVKDSLTAGRPYQLAFVDIRMPGLDGVETIAQIWPLDPGIQIVICTAYADYSQEDLTTRLGHTDNLLVLKKPFDNIEVTQLARTLTKKWHLARQAALKLEQMELLLSQRTQKILEMQRCELLRLQELDQRKTKSLRQFAAEFRPPLAGITELLRKVPVAGAIDASDQEQLLRQAGQLSMLVDHLQENDEPQRGLVPPTSPPPASLPPETSPVDGKYPLVLLIENNPDLSLYLRQLLGADFKIIEALDDQAGRAQALDLVPDIIIADILPPQVNGIELCKTIKAGPLTSHIPVILLNTSREEDCQLQALQAGADDYIPKPFDLSLLKARVHNLLAMRRQLRASFNQQSGWQPRDLAVNQADAHFLERILTAIEQNLPDFEFDVEALARSVAVSRRQLFRKLKAVVDLSPKALIRSVRLKRAAQLLLNSEMTVTEITFAVGFQDVKHFRNLFKEQFGVLPSEYLKSVVPPPLG